MIKNFAIGGVVGLLFMSGGFFFGLRFVHVPVAKKNAAVATIKAPPTIAERETLSLDGLRKTSEDMIDVNQALQAREQAVAAREKKAQQREDELNAEQAALDRSHAKFHELYDEFQQRLQLVQANEADQLQRQMTIYTSMDPASAADLLRDLDDGTIVRLFSIMDTKPLSKLVEAWKTKYPADSTRLLTALTQMGHVMPQDKIALSDPIAGADANANAAPASDATAPATSAPADSASGDTSSSTPPATDSASAPADGTPASDMAPSGTDAAANSTDSSPAPTPPAADQAPSAAPVAAADTGSASAMPASDSDSAPSASGTDASSNSTTSAPAADSAPATPATPPAAPALAPPPDTSAGHGTTSTAPAASGTPDSPSLLGVPGETAAQAAEAAQRRSGRLSADISTDRAY